LRIPSAFRAQLGAFGTDSQRILIFEKRTWPENVVIRAHSCTSGFPA
jgi:hypothetical protein